MTAKSTANANKKASNATKIDITALDNNVLQQTKAETIKTALQKVDTISPKAFMQISDSIHDRGLLDRFFGKNNIQYKVTWLTAIITIVILVSFCGICMKWHPEWFTEVWQSTTPIITLITGYYFGKNEKL